MLSVLREYGIYSTRPWAERLGRADLALKSEGPTAIGVLLPVAIGPVPEEAKDKPQANRQFRQPIGTNGKVLGPC